MQHADKQLFLAKTEPKENWELAFEKTDVETEQAARQVLKIHGIMFYNLSNESALNHVQRHDALLGLQFPLKPERVNAHLLHKEHTYGFLRADIHGPILLLRRIDSVSAFHWPSVKQLYPQKISYPFHHITGERLALKTAAGILTNGLPSLEQLEKIGPRKLFNHTYQMEIILNEDCDELLVAQSPYLIFNNAKGTWIKNGIEQEILCQERIEANDNPHVTLTHLLTQFVSFSLTTGQFSSLRNIHDNIEHGGVTCAAHFIVNQRKEQEVRLKLQILGVDKVEHLRIAFPREFFDEEYIKVVGLYNSYALLEIDSYGAKKYLVVDLTEAKLLQEAI